MNSVFRDIYSSIRQAGEYGDKFIYSLVVLVLSLLLYQLIRKGIRKTCPREKTRVRLERLAKVLVSLLGLGGILYIWFNALEGLFFIISILMVIGLLALRDLVLNFAGYAYLMVKRPFAIGDRIEIKGHQGDVMELGLFEFKLAEIGHWLSTQNHTGRMVYIPNQEIFSSSLANYSRDFPYLWTEVRVILSHDSNLAKAKKLLEAIGRGYLFNLVHKDQEDKNQAKELTKLGNQVELIDGTLESTVTVDVTFTGLELVLRFLCPYKDMGGAKTLIWKRIVQAVQYEKDLDFAPYVHQVDLVQVEGTSIKDE